MYRPSSLRDRERTRPALSNVFETQEKRREIQKEIERAQQLLADAHVVSEVGEIPSKPDEEYDEGEELEKVSFLLVFLEIKAPSKHTNTVV